MIELTLDSGTRLYREVCDARAPGELLDGASELPVMSFNVGSGQWFEFKLAGRGQVTTAAAAAPSCSPPLQRLQLLRHHAARRCNITDMCHNTTTSATANKASSLHAPQVEEWAPRFAFWGFRWCQARVGGPNPSAVTVASVEGEFVYADLKRVGTFECSNELWNRCLLLDVT